MTIEQAKRIGITDWLARHGYQPAYRRGVNWWYLSMLPDRAEKTPSFKVNTHLNRWIDFGNGQKGSLIDLGIRYHGCSIQGFLQMLEADKFLRVHPKLAGPRLEPPAIRPGIALREAVTIKDYLLMHYLRQRHIDLGIAKAYCKELEFELRGRIQRAIGFPNDSGGFELRNERLKASISPKASSLLTNGASRLAVFEGFFDFLSYRSLKEAPSKVEDYLVLNSTAFFSKGLPVMMNYQHVDLYFDRDDTGIRLTREALQIDAQKFHDRSNLYSHYKDLNEMLVHTTPGLRPRQSQGL